MRTNTKAVACDFCDVFVHIRCGNIALKLYDGAVKNELDIPLVYNQWDVWENCAGLVFLMIQLK